MSTTVPMCIHSWISLLLFVIITVVDSSLCPFVVVDNGNRACACVYCVRFTVVVAAFGCYPRRTGGEEVSRVLALPPPRPTPHADPTTATRPLSKHRHRRHDCSVFRDTGNGQRTDGREAKTDRGRRRFWCGAAAVVVMQQQKAWRR